MTSSETIGVAGWVAASVAALTMGMVATISMRRAKVNPRSYVVVWLILFGVALICISHLVRQHDTVWAGQLHEIAPLMMIAAVIAHPDSDTEELVAPWTLKHLRWVAVVLIILGLCIAMVLPAIAFYQGKLVSMWNWGMAAAEVVLGSGLVIRYLPVARGRRSRVAP